MDLTQGEVIIVEEKGKILVKLIENPPIPFLSNLILYFSTPSA